MARLETYTASGQTRQGPVAAGVPASVLTAPYEALENVGGAIQQSGQVVSQIAAQRQKENDFRWKEEAATQLKDELIKWQNNPENISKESVGDDFRAFADERLAEYLKAAPNRPSGDLFKREVMPTIQGDYNNNLKRGEHIRFDNFRLSQTNGAIVDNEAYRARFDVDPEGAEDILTDSLTRRLASIQSVYGKIAPANAAQMSEGAVANAVLGTMDTDPGFARHVLNKFNAAVDPQTRETLLNRIEQAEQNARATGNFHALKQIENSIQIGYDTLTPVPPPDTTLLTPHQKEKAVYDVAVANRTIGEYSKLKSWNWQEQQKQIAAMPVQNDPVAGDAKQNLAKMVAKAQKEQTEDPAGWQSRNDPEFKPRAGEGIGERMVRMQRMKSLQGYAPIGTDAEQAKRYLSLPDGLKNVLSLDEARTRAATFNNIPPNQLTQAVEQFDAEFPDADIASTAWNDMQNLPTGDDRLRMGIRVAAAINNVHVRNHFLGAVSSKDVLKTEDTHGIFKSELDANDDYRRFVSGWLGDGAQRSTEMAEFRDSIVKYAEHMSATENLKTDAALDKAVQRVIKDNYAVLNVNGSDVVIYKFDRAGRQTYSDRDYELIRDGIAYSLGTIDPNQLSITPFHFPNASLMPSGSEEQKQYVRKLVRSTGTIQMDPDNASFTVYLKGEGETDFPFQLRGADGLPFKWTMDAMFARGAQLQQLRALQEPFTGIAPDYETDLRGFGPLMPKPKRPIGYFGQE